jgi:anti-anti-sigma factor
VTAEVGVAPASAWVALDEGGGDSVVVVAAGEFDLATADVLSDALERACLSGGDVLVDLRRVRFMDVVALHCILRAQQRLADRSSKVTVTHPNGVVRRLLEESGLHGLIRSG